MQESDKEERHRSDEDHRRAERRYWRHQTIVSVFYLLVTFLAMGGAIASAVFAYGARNASRDAARSTAAQVVISSDTESRQLRAYVGVESVFVPQPRNGSSLTATLKVKNFGVTPAKSVMVYGRPTAGMTENQKTYILPSEHPDAAIGSLFPTGEREVSIRGHALNYWDLEHQAQNVQSVQISGIIRYEDLFGTPRWSDFCYSVALGDFGRETSDGCPGDNRHN